MYNGVYGDVIRNITYNVSILTVIQYLITTLFTQCEYHYWATHLTVVGHAFDLLSDHVVQTFDRLLTPNQGQFALIKVKYLLMPRGGGGGGSHVNNDRRIMR